MPVILQMHFDKNGPFGKEAYQSSKERAESINQEPGFLWKIWTEDEASSLAGGIYLFDSRDNAQKYLEMHTQRLIGLGFDNFRSNIFEINKDLSDINKGPY